MIYYDLLFEFRFRPLIITRTDDLLCRLFLFFCLRMCASSPRIKNFGK